MNIAISTREREEMPEKINAKIEERRGREAETGGERKR